MKKTISLLLALSMIPFAGCAMQPDASTNTAQPTDTTEASQNTVVPDKLIALTFDDGPNTDAMMEIIDVLDSHGAKGTFFVIGKNINDSSARAIKTAYEHGHEIGNHSQSHVRMKDMTKDEIIAEVEAVQKAVEQITGERPAFFRPPFLSVSELMYETIDMPFANGISAGDGTNENIAEDRAYRVINGAYDGVIALMHCSTDCYPTADALHILIPALRAQGYEFVTISELFARMGVTPESGIMYIGTDTSK